MGAIAIAKQLGKLVLCYLGAGVIFMLYDAWPNYTPHAHIPASGFASIVWAPIAPYFIYGDFGRDMSRAVAGLIVYLAAFAALTWLSFRKDSHAGT
jgi:hypothetical protein